MTRRAARASVVAMASASLLLAACSSTQTGGGSADAAQGGSNDCKSGKGAVGYIPKLGTDPYMVTVRKAAEAAAAEIGGKVIYTSPSEATGAAQIPFVNQLVAQNVCVIAISGSDLDSTKAALQAARAKGIKVLSWDSDVSPDARAVFINQAATDSLGEQMLNSMADMLGPDGGQFAVLSSTPTAVNQNAWIASMKKRLKTDPSLKNLELVTVVYGQEKADENARQAKALVQAYPDLKGIIVPAGIGLPAAAQALDQIGKLGDIKLTGLAPASLISTYIKSGDVQDVWWSVPDLGTLSYYAAQALAKGEITGKEGESFSAGDLGTFEIGADGVVILGDAQVVTPENLDKFPF